MIDSVLPMHYVTNSRGELDSGMYVVSDLRSTMNPVLSFRGLDRIQCIGDVNGTGYAELVGYVDGELHMVIDPYWLSERVVPYVTDQGEHPGLWQGHKGSLGDYDGDGYNDVLSWKDGAVTIAWGHATRPLKTMSKVVVKDVYPDAYCYMAGLLDGELYLFIEERRNKEYFLRRVNPDDLKRHEEKVRSELVLRTPITNSDGCYLKINREHKVLFTERMWIIPLEKDMSEFCPSCGSWAGKITTTRIEASFTPDRSYRPWGVGYNGVGLHNSRQLVDLEKPLLDIRTTTFGDDRVLTIGYPRVVDVDSLIVERTTFYKVVTVPENRFSPSGVRLIDDIDGDGLQDLIVSAWTQWDGSDSTYNGVAIFKTTERNTTTTVYEGAVDRSVEACPSARAVQGGWVIALRGQEPLIHMQASSAMIYDVRGRVVGSAVLTHLGGEIMANPQRYLSPGANWLLLGKCLVRLP